MSAILAHALAFARHGFETVQLWQPIEQNGRRICACRKGADCVSPGKHPYGPTAPNGLLSATTETGILKHWWSRYPELNLGVVIPPGVMVLDFDPRHGGELVEFEAEHGELPPSWRVQTGSGGWHCYFRLPDGVNVRGEKYNPQMPNNGTTFTGVDILTTGSYAVAPPSRHVSGRSYAWDVDHHPADVEIAAAPDWLIEKLALRSDAQPGGKSDDQGECSCRADRRISETLPPARSPDWPWRGSATSRRHGISCAPGTRSPSSRRLPSRICGRSSTVLPTRKGRIATWQ